jgi:LmbE family N-acetylglucosaminyl deacetylase
MFSFPVDNVRRVLCLGAHSDDIEIGAGGTLLQLAEQLPDLEVCWVVFSGTGARAEEARQSAEDFLHDVRRKEIRIHNFRESYFPSDWPAIKDVCEEIKSQFAPDLVFTHQRADRHQDHRVLSDLAWNTFRSHLIFEYEILKYDGDMGSPNVFVPLQPRTAKRKVASLLKHFKTQASHHWFTASSFEAVHRIRGIECAAPSGMAEGFYCRKMTLGMESTRHGEWGASMRHSRADSPVIETGSLEEITVLESIP